MQSVIVRETIRSSYSRESEFVDFEHFHLYADNACDRRVLTCIAWITRLRLKLLFLCIDFELKKKQFHKYISIHFNLRLFIRLVHL